MSARWFSVYILRRGAAFHNRSKSVVLTFGTQLQQWTELRPRRCVHGQNPG